MNKSPIFIHSLYRSGSTYLFNVFRRAGDAYWCYQEPENEWLLALDERPEELLSVGGGDTKKANHPDIGNPYFWEFVQVGEALKGLFRKEFCFRDIFLDELDTDQHVYFKALVEHARGRPLLQFCRSFGRARALKDSFSGTHLHLWREPRSQWWSFKINNYFDAATQLIFSADRLPEVLAEAARRSGLIAPALDRFHSLHDARIYAERHPLGATESYFLFFALWVYSNIHLEGEADISVCIDELSLNPQARESFSRDCLAKGVEGIDVADCKVPHVALGSGELGEYEVVEEDVINLFLDFYPADIVSSMRKRLQRSFSVYSGTSEGSHAGAEQARRIARRLMDNAAESSSIAQSENESLHSRLLEIDQLCTSQFEALAIQKEHIGRSEAYQQTLRDALDIKDRHIEQIEAHLGKSEAYQRSLQDALDTKNKHIEQIEAHIARLDAVLAEKAEYQARLEAQRDEYDLALTKTTKYVAVVEAQRDEYDIALTKTTQYVSQVEAQRSRYDEALVSAVAYLRGLEPQLAGLETSCESAEVADLGAKIGKSEAILRKTVGYVEELESLLIDARDGG